MRKKHSATYQNFYASYDLVTSTNYTINWSPSGFPKENRGIRARMKIPFECLVGLRPSKNWRTTFSVAQVYKVQQEIFEEVPFEKLSDQESTLVEIINEFLVQNNAPTIEIGILSETSRWHGFGFGGTMSAALAAVLFLFTHRCIAEDFSAPDFWESKLFEAIYNLASKINNTLRYSETIGTNVAVALLRGNLFLAQITPEEQTEKDMMAITNKFELFEKKFSNITKDSLIPLDYGGIFSWLQTNTKHIVNYMNSDKTYLNRFSEFLKFEIFKDESQNGIFENFSRPGALYQNFINTGLALSIKMIYFLRKLLENGCEENFAEQLIDTANQYRYILGMTINQEKFPDKLRTLFLSKSHKQDLDIGIFPMYSGKMGWGYHFVMKPQIGREKLAQALEDIKAEYPNARIEYANYLHGDSYSPVRLRQDLQNGILAKELSESGGSLYFNNQWVSCIVNAKEILADKQQEDILLDVISGDIFIWGKTVDSTEIKSRNTTIELLVILLSKGIVSNQDLPASTYAKNRGEMQSKIIRPFVKIVEERLGEILPLSTRGSNSDFAVELESTNIIIWVIKKLGK